MLNKNTIFRRLRFFSRNQRLLLTFLVLIDLSAVSILSPVLAASLIRGAPLPLQFTATTPETFTTSLQVTVPVGATASTLIVNCYDCDHTDWGSLSINGRVSIAIWPGPGPSNASGTIYIPVPVSAWRTGSNKLVFTHSQYTGGRVDALTVKFATTSPPSPSTTTTAPSPAPTPSPTLQPSPTPSTSPPPPINTSTNTTTTPPLSGTLPLQFTATTPEILTTSLQVTVPVGAIGSILTVNCYDCDHTDWGSLSVNGGAAIGIWPGPGPGNASGTIYIPVPVSAWRTGSNMLAFTHSQYTGGRVDGLTLSFTTTSPLPLQFTATTPETFTTSLQVTVPVGATASTLIVNCYDCDHTDWGSLSINGRVSIAIWPGPGPSNASGTIYIPVPVSAWRTGSNMLAFTHSQYTGGRVDALTVKFATTSSPTTSTTTTAPTTPSTTPTTTTPSTTPTTTSPSTTPTTTSLSTTPTTTSSSTTASLNWNPPTSSAGVAGYNVYMGTASGVYGPPINVGNVTSYVVNNLVIGNTYYFVVKDYDTSGVESSPSNEVTKSIY